MKPRNRFDVQVVFPDIAFGIKNRSDVTLTPEDVAVELEAFCARIRNGGKIPAGGGNQHPSGLRGDPGAPRTVTAPTRDQESSLAEPKTLAGDPPGGAWQPTLKDALRAVFELTGAESIEVHSGDREPGNYIQRKDVLPAAPVPDQTETKKKHENDFTRAGDPDVKR